jgi:hypothetical protein
MAGWIDGWITSSSILLLMEPRSGSGSGSGHKVTKACDLITHHSYSLKMMMMMMMRMMMLLLLRSWLFIVELLRSLL